VPSSVPPLLSLGAAVVVDEAGAVAVADAAWAAEAAGAFWPPSPDPAG
jgi:hypothetical protein